MKFPSPEFDDAVAAACHGTADDACLEALGTLLSESDAALDAYLMRTELHATLLSSLPVAMPAGLGEIGADGMKDCLFGDAKKAGHGTIGGRGFAFVAGAAAALLLAGLWLVGIRSGGQPVGRDQAAREVDRGPDGVAAATPSSRAAAVASDVVGVFADLQSVVWVAADARIAAGDPIRAGDRVELSDGSLRLDLASGASVRLAGPAIFEVESPLAAVLTMGRVWVTAATPESKGFTIRTRTGNIVDLGTEFVAEALPDGRCRVGVTSGEVRFDVANAAGDGHLLRTGDLMEVEPGHRQVVTRIEQGADSAEFRFPSIESPSADDLADRSHGRATIRCVKGRLYENPRLGIRSASPEILLDGKGQSNPDAPTESLHFEHGDTGGMVLDLGADVAVRKINVFSWFKCLNPGFPSDIREAHRERAAQNYLLYGHSGDEPPAVAPDPVAAGWTLIARVDSDAYFGLTGGARPAQQATSVTSARGSLGRFRHLLFIVQPTKGIDDDGTEQGFTTFFGEIDVYSN